MTTTRILITGAQGIIGCRCINYLLAQGIEVHGVSRTLNLRPDQNLTMHHGDLLNSGFASELMGKVKPTHLLHLAWTTGHGVFWEDPANHDWFDASIHLARKFVKAGGQRLVVAGTCAEYDWRSETISAGKCLELESPLASQNLYGQTKNRLRSAMAAELDISFGWGRVFFPYGPGENSKRIIPHVITSLLQHKSVAMGPGTDVRDFITTFDAGAAFAKLLLSDVQGAVNIATGEGHSIVDVARRIAHKLGHSELLNIGELPARPSDPPYLVGDNNRLLTEVGYSDFMSLDQGLDLTIEWWREQLKQS